MKVNFEAYQNHGKNWYISQKFVKKRFFAIKNVKGAILLNYLLERDKTKIQTGARNCKIKRTEKKDEKDNCNVISSRNGAFSNSLWL